MRELTGIKNLLDGAKKGQIQARNEFARRMENLGFSFYGSSGLRFPHPSEEEKIVFINIQPCYLKEDNVYDGFWEVDVMWEVSHTCAEECEWGCQRDYDVLRRPAKVEEVVEVIRRELVSRFEEAEEELKRDWELAKALPTEEELTKLKNRVEDYLRKNRREIPAVAKLLKLI